LAYLGKKRAAWEKRGCASTSDRRRTLLGQTRPGVGALEMPHVHNVNEPVWADHDVVAQARAGWGPETLRGGADPGSAGTHDNLGGSVSFDVAGRDNDGESTFLDIHMLPDASVDPIALRWHYEAGATRAMWNEIQNGALSDGDVGNNEYWNRELKKRVQTAHGKLALVKETNRDLYEAAYVTAKQEILAQKARVDEGDRQAREARANRSRHEGEEPEGQNEEEEELGVAAEKASAKRKREPEKRVAHARFDNRRRVVSDEAEAWLERLKQSLIGKLSDSNIKVLVHHLRKQGDVASMRDALRAQLDTKLAGSIKPGWKDPDAG
jgi:hypothetical protein